MSDLMRPLSFAQLLEIIINECKYKKTIFSIPKTKFVKFNNGNGLSLFGEKIESPYGPAAGPHTQMAQNIVSAYLCGARFFELKTVQKMDGRELAACVAKPCILAEDEGYNCEWSTELTVEEAAGEYIKAWVLCKVLARELELGDPDAFIFNMSVGYDLDGIKTPKIDRFIDSLKDASGTDVFRDCIDTLLKACGEGLFTNIDEKYIKGISSKISDSVTESTLHGCPPDEIERIATYLITEKGLNTFIKCNPTLLGYETAREILNGNGFDEVSFDEHHFVEDLQWADAVPMFRRLIKLADEKGLQFGLKLTNTFPVEVRKGELPSEEMYMSGRALFPLTLSLALKISEEFDGHIRISYSGGADQHNLQRLLDASIWPVTMATTLLKPGGYQRLAALSECKAEPFKKVDTDKIKELLEESLKDSYYQKPVKKAPSRKNNKPLPLFDCFTSPCKGGCPIGQDVPAYLQAMEEGDFEKAFRIITEKNPMPFTTGTICPHTCMSKCMRHYYEDSVHIREVKLAAAENLIAGGYGHYDYKDILREKSDKASGHKVAIVGAGPAGLAAAFYLSREGADVTIFEKEEKAGGCVRQFIPSFRIEEKKIDEDIKIALSYGAKLKTGVAVTSVSDLKSEGYTEIILAGGAQEKGENSLKEGEAIDALDFLRSVKNPDSAPDYGTKIAIIGAGNTAMDCARAAIRLPGVEEVSIVYRRTARYMPADEEELELAMKDGVKFLEGYAPEKMSEGKLICHVMKAGELDASGRPTPVDTGEIFELSADTVAYATGQRIDASLLEDVGAAFNKRGLPELNEYNETSVKGIYVAGDASKGPSTVVKAMADAQKIASAITGIDLQSFMPESDMTSKYAARKGILKEARTDKPDDRCLGCPNICQTCVDVCPNRANVAINIPGSQPQILHIDRLCNECGNCAVFCPYDGKPYKDKLTLFSRLEDLEESDNDGFYISDIQSWEVILKVDKQITKMQIELLPDDLIKNVLKIILRKYSYVV